MKKIRCQCSFHKGGKAFYVRDSLFVNTPKVYMCEKCYQDIIKSTSKAEEVLNIKKL